MTGIPDIYDMTDHTDHTFTLQANASGVLIKAPAGATDFEQFCKCASQTVAFLGFTGHAFAGTAPRWAHQAPADVAQDSAPMQEPNDAPAGIAKEVAAATEAPAQKACEETLLEATLASANEPAHDAHEATLTSTHEFDLDPPLEAALASAYQPDLNEKPLKKVRILQAWPSDTTVSTEATDDDSSETPYYGPSHDAAGMPGDCIDSLLEKSVEDDENLSAAWASIAAQTSVHIPPSAFQHYHARCQLDHADDIINFAELPRPPEDQQVPLVTSEGEHTNCLKELVEQRELLIDEIISLQDTRQHYSTHDWDKAFAALEQRLIDVSGRIEDLEPTSD